MWDYAESRDSSTFRVWRLPLARPPTFYPHGKYCQIYLSAALSPHRDENEGDALSLSTHTSARRIRKHSRSSMRRIAPTGGPEHLCRVTGRGVRVRRGVRAPLDV